MRGSHVVEAGGLLRDLHQELPGLERCEVHEVLRQLRAFVDHRAPGAVLISEAYVDAVSDLVVFYGQDDEIHLPFNFFLAQVPALAAALFRQAVEEVEDACGDRWPTLLLSNHDIARACDRVGSH